MACCSSAAMLLLALLLALLETFLLFPFTLLTSIDLALLSERLTLFGKRLQHCAYYQAMESESSGDSSLRRDAMMADNIHWISEQEQMLGHSMVFVSAHNGHVAKTSNESTGNLLAHDFGESYYVIGTDFYHTTCNMPFMDTRFDFGFYSHDPLAKAAKTAGLDVCWLDFSKVPADSELGKACSSYMYMGSLGEGYSPLMLVLPMSYRVYQCPSIWYDSLILVSEATPISPKPAW